MGAAKAANPPLAASTGGGANAPGFGLGGFAAAGAAGVGGGGYAHAPFGGGGRGCNAPGHGQSGYGGGLGEGATAFQGSCEPNVGAGATGGATGTTELSAALSLVTAREEAN